MKKKWLKLLGLLTGTAITGSIIATSVSSCINPESERKNNKSIFFEGNEFKSKSDLINWARQNLQKSENNAKKQYVIFDGTKNLYFDDPYSLYEFINSNNLIQEKKAFLPSNLGYLYGDNQTYFTDQNLNIIKDIPIIDLENSITDIYLGKNDIFYESEQEALDSLYRVSEVYEFDNKFFINTGALLKYIKDFSNEKAKELFIPKNPESSSIYHLLNNKSENYTLSSNNDDQVISRFVEESTSKVMCKKNSNECYDINNPVHLEKVKQIITEAKSISNEDYINLSLNPEGVYLIDITKETPGTLLSPYLVESSSSLLQQMNNSSWIKQEGFDNSSISSLAYETIIDFSTNLVLDNIIQSANDETYANEDQEQIFNPITFLLFDADLNKIAESMLDFDYDFKVNDNTIETQLDSLNYTESDKDELFEENGDESGVEINIEGDNTQEISVELDYTNKKKLEILYGKDGILTSIKKFRDSLSNQRIGRQFSNEGIPSTNFSYISNTLTNFEKQIANGKRYSTFKSIPLLRTIVLDSIVKAPESESEKLKGSVSITNKAFMAILDMIDYYAKNQYRNGLSHSALNDFKLSDSFSFGKLNKNLYMSPSFYIDKLLHDKDFTGKENTNKGAQELFNGIFHMFSITAINNHIVDLIQELNQEIDKTDGLFSLFGIYNNTVRNKVTNIINSLDLATLNSEEAFSTQYKNAVSKFNEIKKILNKYKLIYETTIIASSGPTASLILKDELKEIWNKISEYENKLDFSTLISMLELSEKDANKRDVEFDSFSISSTMQEMKDNFDLLKTKDNSLNILKDKNFNLYRFLSNDKKLNEDILNDLEQSNTSLNWNNYQNEVNEVYSYIDYIDESKIINKQLVEDGSKLLENINNKENPIWNIINIATQTVKISYDVTKKTISWAKDTWKELKQKSKEAELPKLFNEIKGSLSKSMNNFLKKHPWIKDTYKKTTIKIANIYKSTKQKISDIAKSIKQNVIKLKQKAMSFLSKFRSSGLSKKLSAISKTISKGFSKAAKWVQKTAKSVIQKIAKLAKGFAKFLKFAGVVGVVAFAAIEILNFILGEEKLESYKMIFGDENHEMVWNGGSKKEHSFLGIKIFESAKVDPNDIKFAAKYKIKEAYGQALYYNGKSYDNSNDVLNDYVKDIISDFENGNEIKTELFDIKYFLNKFEENESLNNDFIESDKQFNIVENNKDVIKEEVKKQLKKIQENKPNERNNFIRKLIRNSYGLFPADKPNDFEFELLKEKIKNGEYKPWIYVQLPNYNPETNTYSLEKPLTPQHPSFERTDKSIPQTSIFDQSGMPIYNGDDEWEQSSRTKYMFLKPYYNFSIEANQDEYIIKQEDLSKSPEEINKKLLRYGYYDSRIEKTLQVQNMANHIRESIKKRTSSLVKSKKVLKYFVTNLIANEAKRKFSNIPELAINPKWIQVDNEIREEMQNINNQIFENTNTQNELENKEDAKTNSELKKQIKDVKKKLTELYEQKQEKNKKLDERNENLERYKIEVYKSKIFDGKIEYFKDKADAFKWILTNSSYGEKDMSSVDYMYNYSSAYNNQNLKFLTIDEFVDWVLREQERGVDYEI